MNYLTLPRISKYGRKSSLRLSFENMRFTKKSRSQLMLSIARDWGEVQRQSTIIADKNYSLKNYSCSGHGGYLLFSNTKLFDELYCVLSHTNYKGGVLPDFYIYEFEEDCSWCLLSLISKPNTWYRIERDWKKQFSNNHIHSKTLKEYANDAVKKYFDQLKTETFYKVI